jgi:LacI family transcriptional regulator, repressor for deo operon, udp, cdd, tsx, nupC, and nupG
MATIRDVAQLAGVSTATVSRVTSGAGAAVRPVTKVRVERAIDQLGYVPNVGPRFLRTQRSGKILITIPSVSDSTSARMLQAIAAAASREGYGILLRITAAEAREQRAIAAILASREAEGVISVAEGLPLAMAGRWRGGRLAEVPAVTVGESNAAPGVCSVLVDSAVAASDALHELIRDAQPEIAVVGGFDGDPRYQRQVVHLREAAKQLGPSPRLRFVTSNGRTRAGLDMGVEIFGGARVPTAVLCLSDALAAGVIRAAAWYHLRIPDDVSVIALDDAGVGAHLEPALSTMTPPFEAIGDASVRLVLERVRGATGAVHSIVVRHDFVARCSTESSSSRKRA